MEYAIVKLLSHPLEEARHIGSDLKRVALEITPTLVKFADPNEPYILNEQYLRGKAWSLAQDIKGPEFTGDNKLSVELIEHDPDGEDKILAGLIYKYEPISFNAALAKVRSLPFAEKETMFRTVLEKLRNIYDKPPREFEYPYYTFDVLLDQGAYYDLKRNRIMTQTPQLLSGEYGYYTPRLFSQVGLGSDYQNAMDRAHQTAKLIAKKYPYEAQYITTKATARRFLMKMNLREAFYFVGLRSRQGGHFTYRKVAQMIYDQIARVHPLVAKYIMVDKT
jgi:hypothetical protein